MSELLRWRKSEGYGACDDVAYQRERNAAERTEAGTESGRTAKSNGTDGGSAEGSNLRGPTETQRSGFGGERRSKVANAVFAARRKSR